MKRGTWVRLFDLHCDTLTEGLHEHISVQRNDGSVDLARGSRYEAWIQAFAAFIPDGLSAETALDTCRRLLAVADEWCRTAPVYKITSSAGLSASCTCGMLLTVENGGALGDDARIIPWLFSNGVRLVGLTWNGDTHWACGCSGTGGLTPAGRCAVAELEQVGIVVDVSHLNQRGFWQLDRMAQRPFIATHSASAAVCAHPRNLTDDQFVAIRDRGGLVGLTLYPEHLGGGDFEQIRRHLEHFIALNGESTLCFGADFDGMTAPPEWDGLSVYQRLYAYLSDCGWSQSLLDAVFYTNAYAFFRRALSA